ncbi:MAG: hypothetical protein ABSB53_03575 [Nitrososphaerales archaeon]
MAGLNRQELIIHRLVEYERSIDSYIDRVNGVELRAYKAEVIRRALVEALTYQSKFIEARIHEIREQRHEIPTLENLEEAFRTKLDYLFYEIDAMLHEEVASPLQDFLNIYLERFGEGNIVLLLKKETRLNSRPLNEWLDEEFSISLASGPIRIWVINCPVRTEMNPLEWPIIIHELAHVLEEEKYKLLQTVWPGIDYSNLPDVRIKGGGISRDGALIHQTLEYICDMIAYRLTGPAYIFRMYDAHLTPSFTVPGSHPSWINRIIALQRLDDGNRVAKNVQRLGELTETIRKQVAGLERETRSEIPGNLKKLDNQLAKRLPYAKITQKDFSRCEKRLSDFLPYTDDVTVLINSGYAILEGKRFGKKVIEHFENDEYKLISEFYYLVGDCVRLARTSEIALSRLSELPKKPK